MEVACGEYGDMVPPLVVAVQNNHCTLYQCEQKLTNCDRLPTHNTLRHQTAAILNDDVTTDDDVTAAGTRDDELAMNCVSLLHNSCRRAIPTLVVSNGDVSCDVTLLKEVCISSFDCSSMLLICGRYKHFIFDNFNYNHVWSLLQAIAVCRRYIYDSTQISDWLVMLTIPE